MQNTNTEPTRSVQLAGPWGGLKEHFLTKAQILEKLDHLMAFDRNRARLLSREEVESEWDTISELWLVVRLVPMKSDTSRKEESA